MTQSPPPAPTLAADHPQLQAPHLWPAAVVADALAVEPARGLDEGEVLRRLAAHVRPDGAVVVGFGTDRGYSLERFDADSAGAGLVLEHRFATWDLRPWHGEASFAVTVLRRPG